MQLFLRHGPEGPIRLTGSTLKIICASVDLGVVYVFVDWLLARDSKRIGPIFVCNA